MKIEISNNQGTGDNWGANDCYPALMYCGVFNVPCHLGAAEVGQADDCLPAELGHFSARNGDKGWQNPAIQIACQSRKTGGFQTFNSWPYRFGAAVRVTDAGYDGDRRGVVLGT